MSFQQGVVVLWWVLLACGGEPAAEAPAEAVAATPVAEIDSPFCPSFEACVEGLPGWGPDCERWYAGDPDCAPLDWSEGPADWIDETSRGIAALGAPGRAPEPLESDGWVGKEAAAEEKKAPATVRSESTRLGKGK